MEFGVDIVFEDEALEKKATQLALIIISELSEYWGLSEYETCQRLNDVNALDEYFFKYYDVLHTQGMDYLVNDIREYVENSELQSEAE